MKKQTSQVPGKGVKQKPLQPQILFSPTVENCQKILEVVNERILEDEESSGVLQVQLGDSAEPLHVYGTHLAEAGTDRSTKECSGLQMTHVQKNLLVLHDTKNRLERTIMILKNKNGTGISKREQRHLPFSGMCHACENPLPLARLFAVPSAQNCVKPCCVKK